MDKAEASEGLNNEIYDRMSGELGNLGTDEAVKEKLLRVCRGLTMTRKIAEHFSYEHILLRAAEEYAEASAALLRMRRALSKTLASSSSKRGASAHAQGARHRRRLGAGSA